MKNLSVERVDIWHWIVNKLPKRLLYFAYMHVFSYATTGKYGSTIVPEITAMEVIQRFGDDLDNGEMK